MRFCLFMLVSLTALTNSFAQSYNLKGNAEVIGGDCYRLTKASADQVGVVWSTDKVNLNERFDVEFLLNFGSTTNGADGMIFIMQPISNQVVGFGGGNLGFGGISPSLGVEFDTFQSKTNGTVVFGDPVFDHIAVVSNGSVDHTLISNLAGPVQASLTSSNIKDGKDHLVRITWEPSTRQLEVYFDCKKRISLVKDIINGTFKGQSDVFWGISATTGLFTNNQTVCLPKQVLIKSVYALCPGQSVNLVGRVSSDNKYSWAPSDGLSSTSVRTPLASPKKSTTYVVSYKNYCGLPVSDTIQVIIPPIDINLGNDTTLCDKSVLILHADNANATYKWQDGSVKPQFTVTQPGVYSAEVTVNNCVVKSSVTIKYSPTLAVNLGRDTSLCIGAKLLLHAGFTGAMYQWQDGTKNSTIEVSIAGTYSVSVTAGSCSGFDAIKVDYAQPLSSPLGPDTTLCQGQAVALKVSLPQAQVTWNDNTTGLTHAVRQPGLVWANIRVNGCLTVDSIRIIEKPVFSFRIGNDTTLCEGKTVVLKVPASPPSTVKFAWSDGTINDSISVGNAGFIWLESNLNGCFFSDSLVIKVVSCTQINVYVPDAFTPNSDGINDVFLPKFTDDGLLSYSLIIYSRWGDVVYATSESLSGWDGSYKMEPCMTGEYTYRINYSYPDRNSIRTFDKSGTVLLIK